MSVDTHRVKILSAMAALAVGTALTAAGVTAGAAQAAAGCRVDYKISSQWPGGFNADVTVTNLGDAVNGWRLTWTFAAGQQVTQAWNATVTGSGSTVTATNAAYNGILATGGSAGFGFSGNWTGSNPAPAGFSLNGTACTGSPVPATSATTGGPSTPPSSTTGPPSTSPSTPPTTSTMPSAQAQTGLVGWATQGGGTTGGQGGSTVTVSTASALDSALQSGSPLTIRVSGMISLSGMHKVASNKSVLGVGSGSGLSGGGLNVSGASNVVIRNLVFRNANDDSINVERSTRVWIDHNDLSNGYDGLVDIKRGSDYVTVSWNKTHDHDKTMLLGHDDANGGEDAGHLRVSYHHNWFAGTNQRHPRVRFGNPVHVYNNYYSSIGSYGVASTCGAGVLVEGNYFENTKTPFQLGAGDSPNGSLVARNNSFVNSGSGSTGGSVASIPYAYTLDPAAGVKATVSGGAGVGKIGL
jgi:pectate lyase